MPTNAKFFQRYVLQNYSNTLGRYFVDIRRYWFQLELSEAQYALLVSNLPADTPLLGALLYYNVGNFTGPDVYAVVWYYSEEYSQISFVAVNFPLSNWPVDFDPEAYVKQSAPITIPEGVETSTVPSLYESSPSLFSCYPPKLRTFPPTEPGGVYTYDTFNPVGNGKQIQSSNDPPEEYNIQSISIQVLSLSTSVKNWVNLNMAYLSGLAPSSSAAKKAMTRKEERLAK
jgi:hypothetical protein